MSTLTTIVYRSTLRNYLVSGSMREKRAVVMGAVVFRGLWALAMEARRHSAAVDRLLCLV